MRFLKEGFSLFSYNHLMREKVKRLRTLKRSEDGNVAVIAALSLLPIILVMGLSFDWQRIVSANMRVQSSIDAALLNEVGYLYANYVEEKAEAEAKADRDSRRRRAAAQRAQENYYRSNRRRHTRASRRRSRERYNNLRRSLYKRPQTYSRLNFSATEINERMAPLLRETITKELPDLKNVTIEVRVEKNMQVKAKVRGDLTLTFGSFLGREDQKIVVDTGVYYSRRTGVFELMMIDEGR